MRPPPAYRVDAARDERGGLPAWLRPTQVENRFAAGVAILAAVALQLLLPDEFHLSPRWLLPAAELLLLGLVVVLDPARHTRWTRQVRYASLLLAAFVTADNAVSAALLDYDLVNGKTGHDPVTLLASAAGIYLTNIIAFGLWYWEFDRGGPVARAAATRSHPDFLFPQMATPEIAHSDWEPTFIDYLNVSFTNATAFSPTDTMPLSRWAKTLMAVQSAVALSTLALVIARAVNILP